MSLLTPSSDSLLFVVDVVVVVLGDCADFLSLKCISFAVDVFVVVVGGGADLFPPPADSSCSLLSLLPVVVVDSLKPLASLAPAI